MIPLHLASRPIPGRSLAGLASALALAVVLAVAPAAAFAERVVIIMNKSNPNVVDRTFVSRVYTGAIKGWPDGSPVFPLDYPEGAPARLEFAQSVLGRSPAALRAIWSQNIFTGKGYPPRLVSPAGEMLRVVASNRHAIGYVPESQVDDTVQVIGP